MGWSSSEVDLLGFSIGSFVAQEIALIRPSACARWCSPLRLRREPAGCTAGPRTSSPPSASPRRRPRTTSSVFFTGSEASRAAGQAVLGRIFGARTVDRDAATSWQTRLAQYDAVCAWGIPNHSLLERVSAIDKPVFVANGDSDPMILPHYSYLLAGLIPGAHLKMYPDAAHGFLFQHHADSPPTSTRSWSAPERSQSWRQLSGAAAWRERSCSRVARSAPRTISSSGCSPTRVFAGGGEHRVERRWAVCRRAARIDHGAERRDRLVELRGRLCDAEPGSPGSARARIGQQGGDALGGVGKRFRHRLRPPGQDREVFDVEDSGQARPGVRADGDLEPASEARIWCTATSKKCVPVSTGQRPSPVRRVAREPHAVRSTACAPDSSGISRKPRSGSFTARRSWRRRGARGRLRCTIPNEVRVRTADPGSSASTLA